MQWISVIIRHVVRVCLHRRVGMGGNLTEDSGITLHAKPSLVKIVNIRFPSRESTHRTSNAVQTGANWSSKTVDLTGPSSERLLSTTNRFEDPDLSQLMPSSVRRHREGVQPDTYPFETPAFTHTQITSDPAELTMERMGGNATKEVKIERFREVAIFALRCFGSFTTVVGTGCYGPESEASLRRQSSTNKEILMRKGVRVPLTNRIAQACPLADWGVEYGSTPNAITSVLNDFVPWPATKLEDFRIIGDKAGERGKPPASIYLVNASMGQRNKLVGAAYGLEHAAGREKAREIPWSYIANTKFCTLLKYYTRHLGKW